MIVEDCAADFESKEFWDVMRMEQFWTDNMDKYWDFYGFWEEYHYEDRDHDDYDNMDEQCVDYDCAADTGLEFCKMTQCYNIVSFEETCEAKWEASGEQKHGSCD